MEFPLKTLSRWTVMPDDEPTNTNSPAPRWKVALPVSWLPEKTLAKIVAGLLTLAPPALVDAVFPSKRLPCTTMGSALVA